MHPDGSHTLREIRSQPEAWAATLGALRGQEEALRALYREGGHGGAIFTGCGSPYYLALAAAAQLQQLGGGRARGLPASEIWLGGAAALPAGERALLVAISRSGETTETLRACEAFRAGGRGALLTLCAYPGRAITALGDLNLLIPAAQEESVAQTRFFSTAFLVTTWLAALWAGRDDVRDELERLPAICGRLLERAADAIGSIAADGSIDRFYFLGAGPRYGLACELSLKMKEMSLSHSEPFHTLEFRHGPKAMAGPGALVVGLLSEGARRHEQAVLDEARSLGARTLTIAERDADIVFEGGLGESASAPLYLPAGQLLAFERARHKGLNPDAPGNLDVFVRLEG